MTPGLASLSGYAFLATSAAEISGALRTAFQLISQARMSFGQASVPASRLVSENALFEASFKAALGDPFWTGYLKKYGINPDGTVGSVHLGCWNRSCSPEIFRPG